MLCNEEMEVLEIESRCCSRVVGWSAVMNEVIKKLEDSEGDEYVCSKWASEKGECRTFRDHNTGSLSFEELVDDSRYLHGWLDRSIDGWQAMLAFYDIY